MGKQPADTSKDASSATADDIRRILGSLDNEKLVDVLSLRPSIKDVEEASLWIAGDADVFGAGKPLQTTAGRIVEILSADEEEDPRPQV